MAVLRAFQAYFVVSALLVLAGIIILIPPTPLVGAENANLDPGYYQYRIIDVFKAGQITGTFSENSGHSIRLYVFTSGQYDSFKADGSALGLFAASKSSGDIYATFQVPGTYYIVIRHGEGLEETNEAVSLNYRIEGMNLTFLGSGLATLFGGVGLWVLGTRAKRTQRPRIPQTRDVILFDRPPLPRQPAPVPQAVEVATTAPPLIPSAPAQPAQETESPQQKLERLEKEIQTMDTMRREAKPINLELFEKTYSTKVEEIEEIRRKMRAMEPLPAS